MNARASFSKLSYYKNCPYAYKLKYLDKTQTLPRPASCIGKTGEAANDRGSRVHEAADDYINSRRDDLVPELIKYRDQFKTIREIATNQPDLVHTEQKWTFNPDWKVTDAAIDKDYELLAIIDIFIFDDDTKAKARVIDIKTGKKFNNEVKHATQTQLYQLTAFKRYPTLESVTTELWYVDQKHGPTTNTFSRAQGERFTSSWQRRIDEMKNDTEFKARPHERSCAFCDWGLKEHSNKWIDKTGDCKLSRDKRDR